MPRRSAPARDACLACVAPWTGASQTCPAPAAARPHAALATATAKGARTRLGSTWGESVVEPRWDAM
eukprot:6313408-Pyramimonas_sp.AAC.1